MNYNLANPFAPKQSKTIKNREVEKQPLFIDAKSSIANSTQNIIKPLTIEEQYKKNPQNFTVYDSWEIKPKSKASLVPWIGFVPSSIVNAQPQMYQKSNKDISTFWKLWAVWILLSNALPTKWIGQISTWLATKLPWANIIEAGVNKAVNIVKNKKNLLSKSVNNIIQEAKKYKSAEEFIKARGETLYHGTPEKFDNFSLEQVGKSTDSGMFGNGIYFTDDLKEATTYSKRGNKVGEVKEVILDLKKPYIIKTKADIPKIDVPNETIEQMRVADKEYSRLFTEKLQKEGYDGVIDMMSPGSKQYVVFNPSQIKTKSQLIDIWNKANNKAWKPWFSSFKQMVWTWLVVWGWLAAQDMIRNKLWSKSTQIKEQSTPEVIMDNIQPQPSVINQQNTIEAPTLNTNNTRINKRIVEDWRWTNLLNTSSAEMVSPKLLSALLMTENRGNLDPEAVNKNTKKDGTNSYDVWLFQHNSPILISSSTPVNERQYKWTQHDMNKLFKQKYWRNYDVYNAEDNIKATVLFLQDLIRRTNGSLADVIDSYNKWVEWHKRSSDNSYINTFLQYYNE